ncbi:MAG: ABC transporter permease [Paenibacillus dendritiformis]|uniref:ABC transporter permease n=1 Tax=Paenibacillus dendritiformis TaxID=130049 RepID=UPI00143E08B6|nr:ABC transporter permease [Paenibacillus dendritiformis]MDU5144236.1 ABC transporter permease [Paenibacillus dendritiformis]NKI22456.1 ABC transporter permease [Paenibacillus dendritiformis]NRF97496.1 ABC transporter permease [Paenibacillus dendritiformis]
MVNLVCAELLKLKRAKMFMVSLIGAAAAPIMVFIGYLDYMAKKPGMPVLFSDAWSETNLYTTLLIGTLLYGVITAYLFNREYAEDTLKNLLTIPVSRTGLIASKLVLLFLWIMVLTFTSWGLTFIFGLLGQFEGLTAGVVLHSLKKFFIGGSLLFLLSTPTMFVSFLFKNYVPTIIFTAVITMGNVALANREYKAIFPWSAVHVIAENGFVPAYPPLYSYAVIIAAAVIGLMAAIVYFNKSDIH